MPSIAVRKPVDLGLAQELERLYRDNAPLIYRTAWGVLGSREDAEDVVQSVFLALMRRESLPDLQTNPKAYLCKAAVTVSLDLLKAKRRRPVLVDDVDRLDVAAADEGASFDEELYERLYDAIAQLDARAAGVVILRYMHQKSLSEIAKELHISCTAAGVRLFRARARLRTLLRVSPEKGHGIR